MRLTARSLAGCRRAPSLWQRLSGAFACAHALTIDRTAFSRTISVLGVQLDGASCATFLDDAQPHLLRMQGVKPVRLGSKQGRRLVLLSETLQDVYTTFPPDLQAAVVRAGGELETCNVTVGYDNLGAHEVLRTLLPADVTVPTGYEEVGHVVHLNLRAEQKPHRYLIGQVLLDKLSPRVRTVVNKAEEISSQFRSLPLELIAGEDEYHVQVQHGAARLRFDYSRVYWSSRLHSEHMRTVGHFARGDHVWDLFAGVGPFAMLAGLRGVSVLANDLNPHACSALMHNAQLNGVEHLVHAYNLDAATFVQAATAALDGGSSQCIELREARQAACQLISCADPKALPKRARRNRNSGGEVNGIGAAAVHVSDAIEAAASEAEAVVPKHILMNLPADSLRFLAALEPLRDWLRARAHAGDRVLPPVVHCYSFSTTEEGSPAQLQEARKRVAEQLAGEQPTMLTVRTVRSVAPGKNMLCYEFPLDC